MKHPNLQASEASERAIINSALWAAAGDALGWITELSRGAAGVKNRTGASTVEEPVAWTRMIGGRNGPKVSFPAGTYSDDTQLRLAVSRSIRGDGAFDVETFAKIEITVWPTYALGGGVGTKAAAANLARRGVNWFSNFYEKGSQKYISGGGNGAAMRIQPHVWASSGNTDEMLLNVLRDSLVTHGHPHGFCGAVFHALALNDVLENGQIPTPDLWKRYADKFDDLPRIISKDYQLEAFWRSAWETSSGVTLVDALRQTRYEALRDINIVVDILESNFDDSYHQVLSGLDCLGDKYRGSGFKTALAASALAYIYHDSPVEDALVSAANELDSDTDTIATMAGALLGALAGEAPRWRIQDSDYIIKEARRLAKISGGVSQYSFSYPDLGRWNPPASQGVSIGRTEQGLALAGLGNVEPSGQEYRSGDSVWQWFTLSFGQTILAKRKASIDDEIMAEQVPSQNVEVSEQAVRGSKSDTHMFQPQPGLPFDEPLTERGDQKSTAPPAVSLDAATDAVIAADFDDEVLGRLLNTYIDSSQSIESALAFVAIIAKAKLTRARRRR